MSKCVGLGMRVVLATVMLLAIAAPAFATEVCPPEEPPCYVDCRTPGFWKNHPDAWPVESITIGGVTYTKSEAIALLMQPDGDKSQTLFRALLAARLNVLAGCGNSVAYTMGAAEEWLVANPLGSGVAGSSDAWKCGEPLYWCLDAFNNQ